MAKNGRSLYTKEALKELLATFSPWHRWVVAEAGRLFHLNRLKGATRSDASPADADMAEFEIVAFAVAGMYLEGTHPTAGSELREKLGNAYRRGFMLGRLYEQVAAQNPPVTRDI
jgi:hypothetical protein